jgi:hypothetical protein
MVTHETLVTHYAMALEHWDRHAMVREHAEQVGLNRRMYCEFFATRHLDATTWTNGTGLDGNRAYDDALRHRAMPRHENSRSKMPLASAVPSPGAFQHGELLAGEMEGHD